MSSFLPAPSYTKYQNQHKTYIYFPKPCSVAQFIPIHNNVVIPTKLDAVSSSTKTEMIFIASFFFSKSRNLYICHGGMPVLFGIVTTVSSSPGVSYIDWNVRAICSSVKASVIRILRHFYSSHPATVTGHFTGDRVTWRTVGNESKVWKCSHL